MVDIFLPLIVSIFVVKNMFLRVCLNFVIIRFLVFVIIIISGTLIIIVSMIRVVKMLI